ncbi:MAG TPA: DUF559 domain-containing protein [Bacteroidales bacterium]|nr:DUF559 domain-containing protein [Bacteroidales bacterium]
MKRFFSSDYKLIKKSARELRRNQTDSEALLWEHLRGRKLGHKFLRQHPIVYKGDLTGLNYFIADFYCHETKTVVELDGEIHEHQFEYDQFRDEEMKLKGLNVLRIKNEELSDIPAVLNKISEFIKAIPGPLSGHTNSPPGPLSKALERGCPKECIF